MKELNEPVVPSAFLFFSPSFSFALVISFLTADDEEEADVEAVAAAAATFFTSSVCILPHWAVRVVARVLSSVQQCEEKISSIVLPVPARKKLGGQLTSVRSLQAQSLDAAGDFLVLAKVVESERQSRDDLCDDGER